MRLLIGPTIVVAALAGAAPASAQDLREVEVDKSAAADLYVKKRPPIPESPRLPKILEKRLLRTEKQVDTKRQEAIGLLREFLASKPTGDGRAEGLFKLAELLWEDARHQYIAQLDRYERRLEACRSGAEVCAKAPVPPELSFAESEKLYRTLLEDHPHFRRIDLVIYLIGFAAREDGRPDEAIAFFDRLIAEHPDSALYGDAWLMKGEYQFAEGRWREARAAYTKVLTHPDAEGYDLALFKSAWCDWKLGDTDSAAKRFKKVLDLAAEAERSGTARERKRRAQLREEALDYLVLVFTEDESIQAADVFDFLASIGGERYSQAVIVRLADVFFSQADYERSVEAYRFLIERNPSSIKAPTYQRRIVDAFQAALEGDKAMAELDVLVSDYSPRSKWAKANASHKKTIRRVYRETEELVRGIAKGFHADAQSLEKSQRRPDIKLYTRAAETYGFYLESFSEDKHAAEIRFLRAEILFFKLGELEAAGDAYLTVGKSTPVGKYHKDALRKAMAAFRKARPENIDTSKRRELLPVDRKFAEATDLYATLFPADPELVGVIFENGQLFYDYGDYDEAIKRFGLIVTKYPDHEDAGAAGDRILDALNKAEDYENIEQWARKLRKAKGFSSPDQLARLDRLIVESIGKSGEKYATTGDFEKAASFYLRIPKEFPEHALAPQGYFNAAVNLEKAKLPEEAATSYLALADRYPRSDLAARSAFTAGKVYESVAYFERAAESYELAAVEFPRSDRGADALFNAGVLRQALGQHKRAIRHYQTYAKRYRGKKDDAEEVAFRIGVVFESSGDEGRAERAYKSYLKRYRRGVHALEAQVRSARLAYQLGHNRRAKKRLAVAIRAFSRLNGDEKKHNVQWAAEARYYQGELLYRQYDRVSLDVKPRRLDRTLKKKMKLLDQASEIYLDVVEYGDPQWATAALYRIGSVMEEFSVSLRDAPTPKGFSEEEAELYRQALDNEVITIEEKAIELYTRGYEKALELKVYNDFTKKLREALGRMAASRFPPLNESRQTQRLGDRQVLPALVKEVIREE